MDAETHARQAQALLDSEAFKSCMEEMRRETYQAWASTNTDDKEGREQAYYLHIALALLETRLQSRVDSVKISAAKAEQNLNFNQGEE